MSARLDEDLVRSRTARLTVWAFLLAYVAVYVYAERTGTDAAFALQDLMFGVLMAGFGVYLAAEYDPEDRLMAAAAGLFLVGGAANVVGVLLGIVGLGGGPVASGGILLVVVGFLLWVAHWIRTMA